MRLFFINIPHRQEFSIEYAHKNFNQIIETAQKEAVTLKQNKVIMETNFFIKI